MINGFKNEIDFINSLNNHRFDELSILLQDIIIALYPNILKKDIIKAYKYGRYAKADIVVSVRNKKRGISLKSGYKNSVHLESIKRFTKYLKDLGETKDNIDSFLRYIYSDGTTDNSGTIRISNDEYIKNNADETTKLNIMFNKYKSHLIKRFLIDTYVNYRVKADIFIHGTINDFIWVKAEDVQQFLETHDISTKSVHCGKLYIQNWNKNISRNTQYEHCREYIQIKWFSMYDDMIAIMANKYINKF